MSAMDFYPLQFSPKRRCNFLRFYLQLSVFLFCTKHIKFNTDTILNSICNQNVFDDILHLIDSVLHRYQEERNLYHEREDHIPCKDALEKQNRIPISEEPIPISRFVYMINLAINTDDNRGIKATDIVTWLEEKGYLSPKKRKGNHTFRLLTEKSKELGLIVESKVNKYGNEYDVILYPPKAQEFISCQLDSIMMEISKKKYIC